MQNELEAAGERIRELAQHTVQMKAGEAEQRGLAQQAQQDASRLQNEVQSLSEVLAQHDSDLQVNSCTSNSLSTTEGNRWREHTLCVHRCIYCLLNIAYWHWEPHLGQESLLTRKGTGQLWASLAIIRSVPGRQRVSLHAVGISVGCRFT